MRPDDHLERWRDAGLLTAAQADRIHAHETARSTGGGRSRTVEALGYLGGALALVAAAVVLEDMWADLAVWGQGVLLLLLSVVLLVVGAWAAAGADEMLPRLGAVLWLLSTAALAAAADVVADAVGWSPDAARAAAGGVAVVHAGFLWRARRTAVQLTAMAGAVLLAVSGALALPALDLPTALVGVAGWAVAVGWLVLTWSGRLVPRRAGFVLGALGVLLGSQVTMAAGDAVWPQVLGLASTVALIAVGVVAAEVALVGLGTLGAVVFTAETVLDHVEDALGVPLALFVVGLVLVASAVVLGRVGPHARRRGSDQQEG